MVVLWVVLEDLRALLVVEVLDKVIDTAVEFLTPLFVLDEPDASVSRFQIDNGATKDLHLLCKLDIKLPCTEESQLDYDTLALNPSKTSGKSQSHQTQSVESLREAALFEHSS